MSTSTDRRRAALLREAAGALKGRNRRMVGDFMQSFYAHISLPDLNERGAANMAGSVGSICALGAKRRRREMKLRVYNPDPVKDGWKSAHTIIEIVNDDMPFLVDSVTSELSRQGIEVHLVIHPVYSVERDGAGNLKALLPHEETGDNVLRESFMSFDITRQRDPKHLAAIEKTVSVVLRDVRSAVEDWHHMRRRIREIIDEMKLRYAEGAAAEVAEAQDFLQWLHDDNFTFLGYRDHDFKGSGADARVSVNRKTGLGILRDSGRLVFNELRHLDKLPADVRRFVRRRDPVVVSKADSRATVHRPVRLDAIGIKRFDDNGKVAGERLFVGLFTSVAYSSSPRSIPLLRRKLDKTIAKAGLPAAGHAGKALMHILETYPRDELFQIRDEDLMEISMGILQLQERQRVALFVRRDDFNRFVSCLVYIPRERYTTGLGVQVQRILSRVFDGEVSGFNTEIGDSPLARLHVIITTTPGKKPSYDHEAVEAELSSSSRSWSDHLRAALVDRHGEEQGFRLLGTYGDAFPASYTEKFDAETALSDIELLQQVVQRGDLNLDFYRPEGAADNEVRFKVFHPREPLPLSDVLPMLEDMGLKVIDEVPHNIEVGHDDPGLVMLHDFGLVARDTDKVDLDATREIFHDAFRRIWNGEMESDGFNALVLTAKLTWREISIIRAFAKYLRQAAIPFSQDYMVATLRNNPAIAERIVRLFQAKFDPDREKGRARRQARLKRDIMDRLEDVVSADEDRILRRFVNLVEAALRTNFYQYDAEGQPKPYISIKYDSRAIDELPLPRPLREIFVYSPRVEAVHLRGGMVARGGLRWSDRPEDFRTEILGLMKAQMVKNTVIVPVGSKGGFVVKRSPAGGGREAYIEEGIACYKTFMSGLLDITDNIAKGGIVAPGRVVRADGDDPYLVVAADKGTATFSDIANGVAMDYGFWLGDAYASGGSVGYDHKKMGITARGAWESVKRHFREAGKDIQAEDFTCIGVGDMSGDVFGNGMLLSKHMKLIAAFNHLHIFVDPDPDPAKSLAERKRLFKLARSSWTDYDKKLISKGGGVFERSAKSISLTAEIRNALGISKSQVTPNELIQAILRSEVELLWFGGIGTFVKSSDEGHADADDRTNDAVRIDARELNCRVIGEGANLGVTQLGRIEYALKGGRLNADFIDNSAGVDCSDHEVNIKILLDSVVAKGKLTQAARDKLLENMTGEVAELVLRDNYLQTQAITMFRTVGADLLDLQIRLIRAVEKEAGLDREMEFLPDEEALNERERARLGLTRPEISVVLSYAKLWVYDEILASDLPDAPELQDDLINYFPTPLRKKYRAEICDHQLRRELITTIVTNDLLNRVGGSFVINMVEKTGAGVAEIARAFIAVRDSFGIAAIWDRIEALDNKVSAQIQMTLMLDINQLIERATLWLLRNAARPIDLGEIVGEFAGPIESLAAEIEKIVPAEVTERIELRVERYRSEGIPKDLARRAAYLLLLVSALDIVRASRSCKQAAGRVAELYFRIGENFSLGWLRHQAERLPADSHWQKLAADAVIEELYAHQKGITLNIVNGRNGRKGGGLKPDEALADWTESHDAAMNQTRMMLTELETAESVDLSMLAVASRHLAAIAQSG